MTQDACSPSPPSRVHTRKYHCNPVKRFGDTPLESQMHDPLVGIFEADSAFVSSDPNRPLTLVLSRNLDGEDPTTAAHAWFTEGQFSAYSVFASIEDTNTNLNRLCVIRPHHRSMLSWKRTVYAALVEDDHATTSIHDKEGNAVGAPMFNVRKAIVGRPTYYAYLGGHTGGDLPACGASSSFAKSPFLVMSTSNNSTEFVTHFKFTAMVASIRTPTGDTGVDSVMAVEGKSELMVLASINIRDVFVFLRLGAGEPCPGQRTTTHLAS